MDWPDWWDWEIELTPHLLKRMLDRSFSETDLREMFSETTAFRPSAHVGRFVVETTHDGAAWELVVEPDELDQLIVVVTAYPVSEGAI